MAGRPKKIDKNPFIFSSGIRTNKVVIASKLKEYKDVDKNTATTSYNLDLNAFKVHIDLRILEKLYNKSTHSCTVSLFLYITSKLYNKKEQVKLELTKISNETGYSISTIRKALKELIDLKVIARRKNEDYWINPILIFKGDRIAYIAEQTGGRDTDEFKEVVSFQSQKKS